MSEYRITRDNLPQAVQSTLAVCNLQLTKANNDPTDHALVRDLVTAVEALQIISSEIQGGQRRPKNQRSALFTRYVIDEEEQMVMDTELKNVIVQIEDVYSRLV